MTQLERKSSSLEWSFLARLDLPQIPVLRKRPDYSVIQYLPPNSLSLSPSSVFVAGPFMKDIASP